MNTTKGKKAVNGVIGGVIGAGVALFVTQPAKGKWVKENAAGWKQKWKDGRDSKKEDEHQSGAEEVENRVNEEEDEVKDLMHEEEQEQDQENETSMKQAAASKESDSDPVKTELKREDDTKSNA